MGVFAETSAEYVTIMLTTNAQHESVGRRGHIAIGERCHRRADKPLAHLCESGYLKRAQRSWFNQNKALHQVGFVGSQLQADEGS
jgi:hypothetical protein